MYICDQCGGKVPDKEIRNYRIYLHRTSPDLTEVLMNLDLCLGCLEPTKEKASQMLAGLRPARAWLIPPPPPPAQPPKPIPPVLHKIEDMDVFDRVTKATLKRAGIRYLEDLSKVSLLAVANLRGIGVLRLRDIREAMGMEGIEFATPTEGEVQSDVRGICSVCGCTDGRACPGGCEWANEEHTLCTRCADKE